MQSSEQWSRLYEQYQQEQRDDMEPLLKGLQPNQLVPLSQLPGAIVDGRSVSEESARKVVEARLRACRQAGVSEDLIEQFQAFGKKWADLFNPQSPPG
ncbi:MAG: hypothetical protein AAB961_01430 [Patescibacteria group bacterium]